jgi:small GTP-binding protein
MIRKKILLIGDFGVGKTSLIRRYIDNTFDDRYLTTIGVKISRKHVRVDEIDCELLIWDIEGTASLDRVPLSYLKGASGIIFVCDISRKQTILNLRNHIDFFLDLEPIDYVVACNKTDLLSSPPVIPPDIASPEQTILTSAKENTNVDQLFSFIAQKVLQ